MKRTGVLAADLPELQRRLTSWRARCARRRRLPEWLWASAVALARSHGVSGVARVLRLDYYALKRRLSGAQPDRGASGASPAFVELGLVPSADLGVEYRVELSAPSGRKMTLAWRGDAGALVALAEAFWRRAR